MGFINNKTLKVRKKTGCHIERMLRGGHSRVKGFGVGGNLMRLSKETDAFKVIINRKDDFFLVPTRKTMQGKLRKKKETEKNIFFDLF